MINNKFKNLLSSCILILAISNIQAHQENKQQTIQEYSPFPPLNGKIVEGRYYSPENLFSCQAIDFDQENYIHQDAVFEIDQQRSLKFGTVAFYNNNRDFKKIEVLTVPQKEDKTYDRYDLKKFFEIIGPKILKEVDNARDIEILKEEEINKNALLFVVSIRKMSVLRASNGKYLSCTRGYLAFQENNKVVMLICQIATQSGEKHLPKKHIERIKNEIFEFKNSLI